MDHDEDEELKALQAELDELRKAAAERERRGRAERRKREMRMEAENAKALAAAIDEHGEKNVRLIETESGGIIVRRPDPAVFKSFVDRGRTKWNDMYLLVTKCLVHPTTTRLDEILEELPAVCATAANEIATLAGVGQKELSGKS